MVGDSSATAGEFRQVVPECSYTASVGHFITDQALGLVRLKAAADQDRFLPLVTALFGTALTTCGHGGQAEFSELVFEIFGPSPLSCVAITSRSTPTSPPASLGVTRGTKVVATATSAFARVGMGGMPRTRFHFADDGRFVFAVSAGFGDVGPAKIIAIDVRTLTKREERVDAARRTFSSAV